MIDSLRREALYNICIEFVPYETSKANKNVPK
jgi:hypothetical protein